jgi:hypothetical protein
MTLQPDSGYLKSRAELINYELAAFAALLAGVPDCYRDGGDNTAWGFLLHALARKVGALDYLDQYALISRNPALLTPPDLLRQYGSLLPLGQDYPSSGQFDQDFKTMVLRMLKAYQHGARIAAFPALIEAFTGADPSTFTVTEMYTLIGTPGVDVSYRNTIRIQVPIGGSSTGSSAFTSSPHLIQDVYQAIAATKAAHIGVELIGVFPGSEQITPRIQGIQDPFALVMAMTDGADSDPALSLAPYDSTAATVLSPGPLLDLTYQWFKNGVAIPGAVSAELNLVAELDTDDLSATDIYYVQITDPVLGSVWSQQIPLQVTALDQDLPLPLPAQAPVQIATGLH